MYFPDKWQLSLNLEQQTFELRSFDVSSLNVVCPKDSDKRQHCNHCSWVPLQTQTSAKTMTQYFTWETLGYTVGSSVNRSGVRLDTDPRDVMDVRWVIKNERVAHKKDPSVRFSIERLSKDFLS